MGFPFEALTRYQRFWYAQMIVAAVLADNKISQSETEYIKVIMRIISRPEEKAEILRYITEKKSPLIIRPPGIQPKILAAVFVELCLVLISDLEFTGEEQKFLEEVAEVFQFTGDYYKKLLIWNEEGLAWKKQHAEIVNENSPKSGLSVPVSELSLSQRRWYAEVIIGSIMCDHKLDAFEVKFLKIAINLVSDPAQKQELAEIVRNGKAPVIKRHPDISKGVLVRIFIEALMILSSDEVLNAAEQKYLNRLATLCDFDKSLSNRLTNWGIRGIKWKRTKNELISQCQILKDDLSRKDIRLIYQNNKKLDETQKVKHFKVTSYKQPQKDYLDSSGDYGEKGITNAKNSDLKVNSVSTSPTTPDHPDSETEKKEDNNAIIGQNLSCFICGGQKTTIFFQLKPGSHKIKNNIFGISKCIDAADGFDFFDYNRCKVAICSVCFFASTQKQLFKNEANSKLPKVLQYSELEDVWAQDVDESKLYFKENPQEIARINRSLKTVTQSYMLAIRASNMLAKLNNSSKMSWHAITLRLTLAEVLMSANKVGEAEDLLKDIKKQSIQLFKSVKNNFVVFRGGRLILLISLYFRERKTAAQYLDYFKNVKEDQYDELNQNDKVLFKRIFNEIKRAYTCPDDYGRDMLTGFS